MNLLLSLNESTANWHFIDTPFPQNNYCRLKESKNVVWAINTLEKSITSAKLQSSKALEMVFLEHYIADIHQPLLLLRMLKIAARATAAEIISA